MITSRYETAVHSVTDAEIVALPSEIHKAQVCTITRQTMFQAFKCLSNLTSADSG